MYKLNFLRIAALIGTVCIFASGCGGGGDSFSTAPTLPSAPTAEVALPQDGEVIAPSDALPVVDAEAVPVLTAIPRYLPDTVIPINYHLWLRPDQDLKNVNGRADVEIYVKAPTENITIAAHNITFDASKTTLRPLSGLLKDSETYLTPVSRSSLIAPSDLVDLQAPNKLSPGKYMLHMEWRALIKFDTSSFCKTESLVTNPNCLAGNQGLIKIGLNPRSDPQYTDALMTYSQSNYMRQYAPGWDEPAFRMVFELEAEIPSGWRGVSNAMETNEIMLADGWKRISFEKTLPIATQAFIFSAGYFGVLSDNFINPLAINGNGAPNMPLRWFTPKDKVDAARFGMDWLKEVMTFYYEYTDVPLPIKKVDHIAMGNTYGNFTRNGNENFGAIFLSGNQVLAPATSYGKMMIAHEFAHQWFGNLVTVDWWDDIWLSESFATWLDRKSQNKLRNYFDLSTYITEKHNTLFGIDRAEGAPAIQLHLTDAHSKMWSDLYNTVYYKGSQVLQMLESHLGEEAMRKTLRMYLKENALKHGTPEIFWNTMDRATGNSIASEIGKSFTTQYGVPLLAVSSVCESNGGSSSNTITISQEALTYSPEPDKKWTIPVSLAYGAGLAKTRIVVLSEKTQTFQLDECGAVFANTTGFGYYIVNYESAGWEELLKNIALLKANKIAYRNLRLDVVDVSQLPGNRIDQKYTKEFR